MDLFMPAERVLYDRAYYLSDEAERDYAFEVAEEHGIDVGEVLYSDELMKEVRDALDRDIDLYLDDEIANFDSMLRELNMGFSDGGRLFGFQGDFGGIWLISQCSQSKWFKHRPYWYN